MDLEIFLFIVVAWVMFICYFFFFFFFWQIFEMSKQDNAKFLLNRSLVSSFHMHVLKFS